MNKAIKELQKYKNILLNEAAIGGYISGTKNIDEALAELLATKAKLDDLRGYCRKQIEHFNSKDSRSDYDWGLRDRTITILDKLDEGKEQR